MLLVPSCMFQYKQFDNYEVCPYSTRYGHLYPAGTFVLKQHCVDELARMLGIVTRALETVNIPYFICGGSLLGYMRHDKQMIPFDDDIDLCIFASDEQLQGITPHLQGLTLRQFVGWWKIKSMNISFMDRTTIAIDLFQMVPTEDNMIVLMDKLARAAWPKTNYPHDLVFPLQRTLFCGVPVFRPYDPLSLLKREYGGDCMDVGYINNIHSPVPYLALNFSIQRKPSKKIWIKHS